MMGPGGAGRCHKCSRLLDVNCLGHRVEGRYECIDQERCNRRGVQHESGINVVVSREDRLKRGGPLVTKEIFRSALGEGILFVLESDPVPRPLCPRCLHTGEPSAIWVIEEGVYCHIECDGEQ